MLRDQFRVPPLPGGLLLLGDSGQAVQLLGEGLCEEILLGDDEIALAGFDESVDGAVAVVEAGGGLLPLKLLQLPVVHVDLGEDGQIVLHVLLRVKWVFRQENGQLGLDPDGGSQGTAVELQPLAGEGGVQVGVENVVGELLAFGEEGAVKLGQLPVHPLRVLHIPPQGLRGRLPEGGVRPGDPPGGRVRETVVQGDLVGGHLLAEQFIGERPEGVLLSGGSLCVFFVF